MSLWQVLTYPFRRGPRRPLASSRPDPSVRRDVPLGMEALDLDLVEQVNRRNDALERINSVRRGGLLSGHADRLAATHVEPIPDDETYAARFHRAFKRKDADT